MPCSCGLLVTRQTRNSRSKGVMGRCRYYAGNVGKALGAEPHGRLYYGKKKKLSDLETAFKTVFDLSEFVAPYNHLSFTPYKRMFRIIRKDNTLRDQLEWNTNYFRDGMKKAGFDDIVMAIRQILFAV
jgi:glycine C-acetyltransferase